MGRRQEGKKAAAGMDDISLWHRYMVLRSPPAFRPVVDEHMRCADGFTMSVQASGGHYCSPRRDQAWPYEQWEIGYPSEADDLLTPYAETPETPTDTVYGYVPTEVLLAVIERHGGLADEARRYEGTNALIGDIRAAAAELSKLFGVAAKSGVERPETLNDAERHLREAVAVAVRTITEPRTTDRSRVLVERMRNTAEVLYSGKHRTAADRALARNTAHEIYDFSRALQQGIVSTEDVEKSLGMVDELVDRLVVPARGQE